ncbi:MAG: hypothetical protein WBW92_08885 [Rhodanobacteraceae bacterium]
MTNLISFLENLGQNANMRQATKPALYTAMNNAQIDADAQWAVLRGDQDKLASVLHARRNMVCLIMAPQAYAEEAVQVSTRFAETG